VGAALTASTFGARTLPTLLDSEPGSVFNVNAPNLPLDQVRGFEPARLARFGVVQTNVAERGEGYVKVTLAEIDAQYEPGTDAALVAAGYASITTLQAVCEAGSVRVPELAAPTTGRG
jgi:5'-nucleotidase